MDNPTELLLSKLIILAERLNTLYHLLILCVVWSGEYVSKILKCNAKSCRNISWFCYAEAVLILVSQKEGTANYKRDICKCFHAKLDTWGYKEFGTLKQFTDPRMGFIKDGTIILQAHIHADTAKSAVLHSSASQVEPVNTRTLPLTLSVTRRGGQENAFKVSNDMNELRKAEILCDVNILVDDKIFPCHRIVLASACNFFKSMFSNNFVESQRKDVTLPNIAPNIFEQLLNFIYTGKIRVDHENVHPLLVGSDFLGLPYVIHLCLAYLENHVPSKNIAQLITFSPQLLQTHIIESVLQPHVQKNFVSLSHDLLSLPAVALKQILTPNCVKLHTNEVLRFLLEWVKINEETHVVIELLKSLDSVALLMDVTCLWKLMTSMMEIKVKECNEMKSTAEKETL